MANKYCNLYGQNKIKDEYSKINDGFAGVETDIDDTKEAIEKIDQRVDELVNNPDPNKDLELVDLRNSSIYGVFPTAKARLDNTDNLFSSHLAENAQKFVEVDADILDLETKKADVAYVDIQIAALASGTPKGVYATLADLQTAFPTGTTGIYIIAADGNWYYWNGSAWTAGGVYQSTGIADNSVSIEKTDFISRGKNLFNKDLVVAGLLNIANGTIGESASYTVSDYIHIKSGLDYVLNSCRNYVLFNSNKEFVSGTDNASNNPVTFEAAFDGYLRASIFNAYVDNFQVELGTTPTTYEPYSVFMDYLAVQGESITDGSIPEAKLGFLEWKANMFDKRKGSFGYALNLSNGALVENALYNVSDYIFIKANTDYVINKCRHYCYYGANKAFVSGTDNASLEPIVINKNRDGYIRFVYFATDIDTIQFEAGDTPTDYEGYGYTISNLQLTDAQKNSVFDNKDLKVTKRGETFIISSTFDSTQDILITTSRNGSANGSFNFVKTEVGGVQIHNTPDDITPIRTFTTVGANHGYTSVLEITMEGHDKTTADLGSQWTDGVTVYTLLKISGNNLYLGCPYTVTNGIVSSSYIAPVGNLIHVSGATHTTTIGISTLGASPQLYPSINNISVKYILDGTEISADGTYYGEELQVQESYNIMDYKSIIDYAQANIGVSYANDDVEGVVRLSINYTFTKGCNCLISHSIKALKKVSLTACGFLQSIILSAASHAVKRYVPGVKEKSGYDFKNIVDMTSYATNLLYYPADFETADKPPNRYVDWLYSGTTKKYGFTMGYIPDKTNSKDADRIAQIGSNYYWDIRSTKKSYPIAINVLTLNEGDYKSFLGYRSYLAPVGDETNINIVKDKRDAYVFIDFHTIATGVNITLNDYIGKSVSVIDSENFTLLNDVVDSDGVTFNITDNYGYAILKIN